MDFDKFAPAPGFHRWEMEMIRGRLVDETGRTGEVWGVEPVVQSAGSLCSEPHSPCPGELIPAWLNELGLDRGKGILYGLGAAAILGALFPSIGTRVQSAFTSTALEGIELLRKARSLVERTREDIEDLVAESRQKGLLK